MQTGRGGRQPKTTKGDIADTPEEAKRMKKAKMLRRKEKRKRSDKKRPKREGGDSGVDTGRDQGSQARLTAAPMFSDSPQTTGCATKGWGT